VVTPAVLLMIFFTIQVGLWLYGRNVALQAAREGVAQLRLVPADADMDAARSEVEGSVVRYAATLGGETLLDPEVATAYNGDTGRVSVAVGGKVISLIPWLDLTVTQQADGEIERFEADE
jgi:hypothetical protein